jgi:hypothetical protein
MHTRSTLNRTKQPKYITPINLSQLYKSIKYHINYITIRYINVYININTEL